MPGYRKPLGPRAYSRDRKHRCSSLLLSHHLVGEFFYLHRITLYKDMTVADFVIFEVTVEFGEIDEHTDGLIMVTGSHGITLALIEVTNNLPICTILSRSSHVERVTLVSDECESTHSEFV